ncbi:MAG: hypothetical protein GY714_03810 [Desulfobacterales bacterium]|nr:hypothetical protein [Desulfobacterales bacterium]
MNNENLRALGDHINKTLNKRSDKKLGFGLLVFEFGEKPEVSYISNCVREDMIPVLRGYADKIEKEIDKQEIPNKLTYEKTCYSNYKEAGRKAENSTNEKEKAYFLGLESYWLNLWGKYLEIQ